MPKRLLMLAILCFALFTDGQSQVSQRITLEDAIRIALDNNFQIERAQNQIELSEVNIKSAYAQFAPTLNAGFNYGRSSGQQFDQVTLTYGNIVTENASGSISTGITLFSGLRNIYNLRQEEISLVSATENERRIRQSVIFGVATAFLQVVLDKELIQISEENLESSRRQLEQINAQVEVGARPLVDRYNQESILANAELVLIQRQNAAANNELRLIRQLQIDPLASYDFVTPEVNEDMVQRQDLNLRELIDMAMASRSDVRAQDAQIKLAYYNLRSAQGARLPTLTASANLRTSWSDRQRDPLTGQPAKFGDQFFDVNIGNSIGMNMQIPIFTRLNNWRAIQASKISYKNAQLDRENLEYTVIQEVAQAYTDYMGYSKELETTERAFIASERAYQTAQERYNVGASTLIELTQANADFVAASSNRVQALFRYIFQEQLIKYYQGVIDENVSIDALR
jgi:outer membrane protein